jgi:molecular chaperone Hsp33
VTAATDFLQPFQLGAGATLGRFARLGPAVDGILSRHAYPPPVAALLAETLALATVLAGTLKYQGVFTLQAQGDGPVSLLLADVTSEGHLRGYARFDAERLDAARTGPAARLPNLLGTGHLAFTVDQGPDTDRYQGIVALEGDTLADCAHRYLEQSEQLASLLRLASHPPADGHGWRAAALMVQRLPAARPGAPILTADEAEDGWRRAGILTDSVTAEELLDPALAPEQVLWRLYNAEIPTVTDIRPLADRCRCSSERVATTLRSFPREDIAALAETDGSVAVTCEFCKTEYRFDADALDRVYAT